jgi:hypothetical protein
LSVPVHLLGEVAGLSVFVDTLIECLAVRLSVGLLQKLAATSIFLDSRFPVDLLLHFAATSAFLDSLQKGVASGAYLD